MLGARGALAALLLLAGAGAAGAEEFPPAGRLSYAITRDGERIGTHTVEFRRLEQRLTVATAIDIKVTALGFTLYDFHHRAEEEWVGGRLAAMRSRTDDDGEARAVEAAADGDRLNVLYNGQPREAPIDILPASLWHPGTVAATKLLDPVRGRVRLVSVADLGADEVVAGGRRVEARHYKITGELNREVWYGADGTILRVRFPAKDGSWITLELE